MKRLQCIAQSDLDAMKKKYAEHIFSLKDIHRRFSKHDADRNRKLTETLTALHRDAGRGEFGLLVESCNFGFEIREAYIYVHTGQQPDCLRYSHLGPAKQELLNRGTEQQRDTIFSDEHFNVNDCKVSTLRERVMGMLGKTAPHATTPPRREADAPVAASPEATIPARNNERAWALGRLQYDPRETPTIAEIQQRYTILHTILANNPGFADGLSQAKDLLEQDACADLEACA